MITDNNHAKLCQFRDQLRREGLERTPSQLIDELMKHWSHRMECEKRYWDTCQLVSRAKAIVDNPQTDDKTEQRILSKLKAHMREYEWRKLPDIVKYRRNGKRHEIEITIENRVRDEQEKERAKNERERKIKEIDKKFDSNFLMADEFFSSSSHGIVSKEEYENRKIEFVRNWFEKRAASRHNEKRLLLDDEQLGAIAAVNGNIQVVARAGSGKTATLVNRTLFLIEHCKVPANNILLLAFNRNAATEIRRRLLGLIHDGAERKINDEINRRQQRAGQKNARRGDIEADSVSAVANSLNVKLPHVMTFHALAYAIVYPEDILYDDEESGSLKLSRVFQRIIDDYIQIPQYKEDIRELMLAHFREDWERIVSHGHDLSRADFLHYKRMLPRESLGGEFVKSWGEKLIADFLFEHNIFYEYERNHRWNGRNYRPDFTVKNSGLIIEYFGLQGDPDYDEMIEKKRMFWGNKKEWELIEFTPRDVAPGDDEFRQILKSRLEEQGVVCQRLSEDEIWEKIRDRAIDRFTKTAVSFMSRCRMLSLSVQDLRDRVDAYSPLSPVEEQFLRLMVTFYDAYLNRLAEAGEEDFNGLMQQAADRVSKGETKFERRTGCGDLAKLQFISIDEFQDFSDLFFRLLSSIRGVNPDVSLFCVGDDWQAINGFAGSDLRFFDEFDKYIDSSRKLYITTNYRSVKAVVDAGNALMSGLGKQAKAGRRDEGKVVVADASKFHPSIIEEQRHPRDPITPMVSRIAAQSLAAGSEVVLLCRTNTLPWYVNFGEQGGNRKLQGYVDLLQSLFHKDVRGKITISTTHRYKGREKPTVIVMDAVKRSYPLIHPDWVFLRVLGNSVEKIIAEEKRLFYVAMTRAAEKLVIITDKEKRSPFLDDLSLPDIVWNDYPPVVDESNRTIVIKVSGVPNFIYGGTFPIKDQIKASGYKWKAREESWTRTCPLASFQLLSLQKEVWVDDADAVIVRICDEANRVLAIYFVNAGRWETIHEDKLASLLSPSDIQL